MIAKQSKIDLQEAGKHLFPYCPFASALLAPIWGDLHGSVMAILNKADKAICSLSVYA